MVAATIVRVIAGALGVVCADAESARAVAANSTVPNGLALALRGPPRGLDQGVASFGIIATSLITLAALIGVALLATRIFKTRIAGIMIGIHATLGVSGFVILAAYVLLG